MSELGPYLLQRRLGAGGMAETFLAIRRGPGGFEQRVCLKRILPAFEQDAEFVRLFLEEARLSAKLRHANVVQVIDFGMAEQSHFLALELIEGLDLRQLLRALRRSGERMPSGLVCHLGYELASALEYAHSGGDTLDTLVHRDISPSNVLLSEAGEVKLSDFGIAKAMSQPSFTRTGTVKGKVPYMAPEYALRGVFDTRCDLFALGVLLYECLVGRRPFDGSSEIETIENIRDGRFEPILEQLPTTPPILSAAVERLIRPDPEERFSSAQALLDALHHLQPPPTARRILGALVREHRPKDDPTDIALDATRRASPSGTMISEGANATTASPNEPTPAGPDEATRTSARPSKHEAPTRAGKRVSTKPPSEPAPAQPQASLPPETTQGGSYTGVVIAALVLAAAAGLMLWQLLTP